MAILSRFWRDASWLGPVGKVVAVAIVCGCVATAAWGQAPEPGKAASGAKAAGPATQPAGGAKAAAGDTKAAEPKVPPAKAAPKAADPTAPAKAAAAEPAAVQPGAAEPAPAAPAAKPAAPIAYKQAITDEECRKNEEKYKRERTNVSRILGAQAFGTGQEASFDAYYRNYALARWTVPERHTSLPEFRRDLRNDLFRGKSGPPYDRLLSLAVNFLTNISGPEYHPVVRYNAMLALGELNVQEQPPGSRSPAVPLPQAFKVLLEAVKSSDSDAVKVAALLGLSRHASAWAANRQQITAGIGDAQVRETQLIPVLLDLAKTPPPAGPSQAGRDWIRALAIDLLATLGTAGPNGSVVTTLVGLVGDKDTAMRVRTAAARALGSLDYQNFSALAPSQIASALGNLAIDISTAELARARAAGRTVGKGDVAGMGPGMPGMAPGMMPGMMPGTMPGMMPGTMPGMMPGMGSSARRSRGASMPPGARYGPATSSEGSGSPYSGSPYSSPYSGGAPGQAPIEDEQTDRVAQFCQRMKSYLNSVRLGLNGPVDAQRGGMRGGLTREKTPDGDFADGLWKIIQEQIKILDNKDTDYSSMAKEIIATRTKLRELLKTGTAGGAAAPAAATPSPAPAAAPSPVPAGAATPAAPPK